MIYDLWMFSIETERLKIRNWQMTDVDDAHQYASDPDVSQFMIWGPNSRRETIDFISEAIDSSKIKPRRAFELAIELKQEQKVVGGIGLSVKDPVYATGMIGYAVNREYWRKGITTEAVISLVQFAFSELDLHRVYATCDTQNLGSQKVLEKCDFRKEAHFKEDTHIKGEWRDSFLYAMLKREWKD